ncbi:kinase-like domain-containing protein [Thelephora terrestris]|uniref:Kinase-like domain-containing protein n=1 Tax=Thelephora terrestris TaxID=56493 RepID=A0A9P6L789_9AGAM|nr:kinase-like domain-containing protein [Thelephora terrestris]
MPGSPVVEKSLNDALARVGGIATQEAAQEFADAVSGMLNSDKGLNIELKSKTLAQLRRVCGRYGVVPTSYVLAGVVKDEPLPQKTGIVTETWKGTYENKPVAIKIFKIAERRNDGEKIKTRFYKEVVLWKRLAHKNILPCLGISRDVAELCLISPWMKNGCITQYIRNNPLVNPLDLLKDTANGLNYLHTSGLIHGDLRAEHIFIGENGQACIANTGHTSIAPVAFGTCKSIITAGTMSLDSFKWRWAAPELQEPNAYDIPKVVATKHSDIYGMGMVIYEVLAREAPFREYDDTTVLSEIQNGKRPRKPADAAPLGITESIWMLLGQCWDWEPRFRPASAHVLNVLREAHQSGDVGAVTSRRLKLKMKDVVISLTTKRKVSPYLTLQYGPHTHTTSRATAVGGTKYTWDDHESWTITLDGQWHGQVIIVQLLHRGFFGRREVLGSGKLSLVTTTMELTAEMDVLSTKGLSGAKVNAQVMAMLIFAFNVLPTTLLNLRWSLTFMLPKLEGTIPGTFVKSASGIENARSPSIFNCFHVQVLYFHSFACSQLKRDIQT